MGTDMWEMDYDQAAEFWFMKEHQSEKMPVDLLKERIDEYIRSNNTCALATASSGMVRCTPLEYVYIDDAFYFFSEGGLKFRGLRENKNAGLAIFDPYSGFDKLRSLQVCGIASMVEPFTEEYIKVMDYRKIPMEAMKKMSVPMNLIKITAKTFDLLDSKLKGEGFDIRQRLEV